MNNRRDIIYHLADIHIKDDRREEYRKVYDALFKELRTRKCAHIADSIKTSYYAVIAGDIFDTKTKISSANITDFYYLVDGLLDICDYVVTMFGNHDSNLNNPNSIDLISPLALWYNDRLIHCADTGTYIVNGVCFNVKSPADSSDHYPYGPQSARNLLILHENVDGVKHNGSRLSGRIKQDNISHYDVVMCGHIHEYIPINGNGAYCGALVQQTIGESFTKGIVEWMCENSKITHTFIPIVNQNRYIKIQMTNLGVYVNKTDTVFTPEAVVEYNSHIDLFKTISGVAPPAKLVIHIVNVSNADEARALCENARAIFKVDPTINIVNNNSNELNAIQHNIQQKQEQSKLIARQLNQNKVSNEIQEEIIKMHNDGFIEHEARAKHTWSLVSLEWSNLFCYAENNCIKFAHNMSAPAIYGIIADNKCGKSSVIDILVLILYNKLLRGDMKNIINKAKSVAFARATFKHDNNVHIIARTFSSDRARNTITYTVNGINSTDDTVDKVYETLEKVVGSFDDFTCINTITQGRNRDFIHMQNQERLDFLKYLFGIDIFEKRLSESKDKLKEYNTMMKCARTSKRSAEIAREIQEVRNQLELLSIEKTQASSMVQKYSGIIPQRPANSIQTLDAHIQECVNFMQKTQESECAKYENYSLSELKELKRTQTQCVYECEKTKRRPPPPSRVARGLSDEEYRDKTHKLNMLRETRDVLTNELRGYNCKEYCAPPPDAPPNAPDLHAIGDIERAYKSIDDRRAKLSHDPSNNPRYKRYIDYVSNISKGDLETEIQTHSKLLKMGWKYSSGRFDRAQFEDLNSAYNKLCDNEITLLNQARDLEQNIEENRRIMKPQLVQYHLYNNSDALRRDIQLLEKIESARSNLKSARPVDHVTRLINGRSSSRLAREILDIKQNMLATNTTYKKLLTKLNYNRECNQCEHNQQAMARIQTKSDANAGAQKNLADKISEKKELIKLEAELEISKINLDINLKIEAMRADLTYKNASMNVLQYALDNFEDIQRNARACQYVSDKTVELSQINTELKHIMCKKQDIGAHLNTLKSLELQASLKYPELSFDDISTMNEAYNDIIEYKQIRAELSTLNTQKNNLDILKYLCVYNKFKKLHNVDKQIASVEIEIEEYNYVAYEKATKALNEIECAINLLETRAKLEKLLQEKTQAVAEHKEYENALRAHELYKQNLESVSNIQMEIGRTEESIKRLCVEENDAHKYEDILKKSFILSEYIKAIDSKTGIPVKILDQSCAHVSDAANSVLNELCDFKIKLWVEARQKTSFVRLNICGDGCELPVDMGSGFQLFVISVAMRVAFSKIVCNSDILIIDEGFACLDDKNIYKIIQILPALKSMYDKIFIISHLDVIKAAIERPIFITDHKITYTDNDCTKDICNPDDIDKSQICPVNNIKTKMYRCVACKYETDSIARFSKHEKSATHMKRVRAV